MENESQEDGKCEKVAKFKVDLEERDEVEIMEVDNEPEEEFSVVTAEEAVKNEVEKVCNAEKNESNDRKSPTTDNTTASTETNGINNEDSITLTIGEDEENLLAEEVNNFLSVIA